MQHEGKAPIRCLGFVRSRAIERSCMFRPQAFCTFQHPHALVDMQTLMTEKKSFSSRQQPDQKSQAQILTYVDHSPYCSIDYHTASRELVSGLEPQQEGKKSTSCQTPRIIPYRIKIYPANTIIGVHELALSQSYSSNLQAVVNYLCPRGQDLDAVADSDKWTCANIVTCGVNEFQLPQKEIPIRVGRNCRSPVSPTTICLFLKSGTETFSTLRSSLVMDAQTKKRTNKKGRQAHVVSIKLSDLSQLTI